MDAKLGIDDCPRIGPHLAGADRVVGGFRRLFDYIKRAMPFSAPGSLSNDEVYAVTAYILAEGNIIDKTTVIDAETLPKVRMPNRDGFMPDPRPELFK
jgi:hypothetical protein